MEELVTNWEELGKQELTKDGSIDKAVSLAWKLDKQLEEMVSLGS